MPSCPSTLQAGSGGAAVQSKEGEVLAALSTIIDPDFGMNIVDCGFIKDLVGAARGELQAHRELPSRCWMPLQS